MLGLLIFFFVLSIAFSFLCSILEAVLLSITPRYVRKKVNEGSQVGVLLEQYKKDIDRPLSAILTLNTIAHTVGAIGVGAVAGEALGTGPISDSIPISWESLVATVMTLAILILSEIIPKTIGANNWKALTSFSVYTIRMLLWILAPLVFLSQLITRTLKKEKDKPVLNRSDFVHMATEGLSSGTLHKEETDMIKNLMQFEVMTVRDIMTPRSVAFMLDGDTTVKDYVESTPNKTFSRIPVFKDDKDNVIGIVLKDDMLHYMAESNGDVRIKDIILDVDVIRDDLPLLQAFKLMTKTRQHLSIVKDEFGTLVGLVSMEDMFETLLGHEIIDESDKVVDMQEYARQKFEGEQ